MPSSPARTRHTITHSSGARLDVDSQGAHLLHWRSASGREPLFLSRTAQWADGVAIRGGVPVIFPQFAGEGPLPRHGFARTLNWECVETDNGYAHFVLADDDATRAIWPQAFVAELSLTLEREALDIELAVLNRGSTAFSFTAALHTYLRVEDIAAVRIVGLHGRRYRDSARGNAEAVEASAAVAIAGEVDRVYFDTPSPLVIHEGKPQLAVGQIGFTDTVIWNPGAERAAGLADLEPDGWRRMLCVEAAAIGRPVTLAPGEQWSGQQRLVLL